MEKFDKKIVKKLMANLLDVDVMIRGSFQETYCDLSNAKDINDVMIAKKTLLLNILRYLPVDGMYCYFCLYTSCGDCSYERAHGKCSVSMDRRSTWSTMIEKLKDLRVFIEGEYWTGEELKKEVASNEKKR